MTVLTQLAMALLPTWSICGLFLYWSAHTTLRRLSAVMRWSAGGWLIVLTGLSVLFVTTDQTCNGDVIYGYRACGVLPDYAANLITTGAILAHVLAVAHAVVLAVVGGLIETCTRRGTAGSGS